ncbi:MAG: PQQ-binding-like beta-propeller repeat protein [Planctomycetaceae bacterium]|nr:PQQ-binding-like beta-propeller repeat protein [Planctomycetaceae bacterium]
MSSNVSRRPGSPSTRSILGSGLPAAILLLSASMGSLAALPATAAEKGNPSSDWPQFLGPSRNGISRETGLLKSWPADGPKQVFRVRGGVGMSGVAVHNGRAVTLLQRGGKQMVVALDALTGKTLCEVPVAPEYSNSMGNGPRATPALAGDMAYVFTGEGILAGVDLKTARVVWSHDTLDELGGREAEYGMASSPLLVGDVVVVTPGAAKGTVAAYDRKTGEPRWQTISGSGRDTAGYSSPTVLDAGGVSQIVALGGRAVIGISPRSGDLLWRYPYPTNFDCNIAVPIAQEGKILISAGENHGSVLLSLRPKTFEITPVWESHGPESVLRNEWQTSILLDGALYGMDNVGGAGPVTHLTCVDFATGKRLWQQKRFGKGNLIAADGKLFLSMMSGELIVLKANPKEYEELGRAEVISSTRQAPSLANGLLYLRDDREILCLDVREPSTP